MQGSIDRLQSTLDNLDKSMKNIESITERIDKGRGDGRAPPQRRHHRPQRRGHHRERQRLHPQRHQAADHRRAAHRVQHPLQHAQELPLGAAHAPAGQVLPHRAHRGSARLLEHRPHRDAQLGRTASSAPSTTTTSEQLRFSLMFGKRVSFGGATVAGRFGIKESTGGVGGDLYLFDDRLDAVGRRLRLRAVDRRPVPAREGRRSAGELWNKTLYLVGGADDLLNYNRARGGRGRRLRLVPGRAARSSTTRI